jgi:peptide/nickel transport system substrate-binding protein
VLPGALAAAVLAVGAAACSAGDDPSADSSRVAADARTETAGGTLTAWSLGPVLAWDPQRIGSRDDMAFAGRVFARTLTAYAPSTEVAEQSRLVGDLATDTGRADARLTSWAFTLRDGVAWEDGKPVTCEDVRYGVSRTFATDAITGGATDALAALAIPRGPDGRSVYAGPYATGAGAEAGRAAFERAVRCDGRTITFSLAQPLADFGEMVSLPAFAPFRQDRDRGVDGAYDVFSTGPYRLEKTWQASRGGTWVRNPAWRPDSDPVRRAYPDAIRYEEGREPQAIASELMADGGAGRRAVSLTSAPPAIQQQVMSAEPLRERSVNPRTGMVDYLAPNTASAVFRTPQARQALAAATNRTAYVTALGGPTAAEPAISLLPPALPAAHDEDPVGAGVGGDPARARALLGEAGLRPPVAIRVAYRAGESADKAMAALAAEWTEGGFAPELEPIEDDYFTRIARPESKGRYDVFWSNWAPAWASASTVLPPLFDSTVNLTAAGPGRDYGYFADPAVTRAMTAANAIADRTRREQAWAEIDQGLLRQGAYVGLAEKRALYLSGSGVRNLSANEVLGGVVEFADIAVER